VPASVLVPDFGVVTPTIRAYEQEDRVDVVDLTLRAWAPVFDSMREVMGREVFDLHHRPDWRASQKRDVESVLADEKATVWVAEEEGVVVGFAAAILRADEQMGELWMMAVDPDHQNRGLGTELTNVATEWMREEGMTHAVISTGGDPGHAPARRTYEKAGYAPFPGVNYFKAL
jgi:GNAT superfamily N-acetyltransferase